MYCSDIDAIVCYACMCMDVCVVFYDCPVGEIHVMIQKKKKDIKEESLLKDRCVRQV